MLQQWRWMFICSKWGCALLQLSLRCATTERQACGGWQVGVVRGGCSECIRANSHPTQRPSMQAAYGPCCSSTICYHA